MKFIIQSMDTRVNIPETNHRASIWNLGMQMGQLTQAINQRPQEEKQVLEESKSKGL